MHLTLLSWLAMSIAGAAEVVWLAPAGDADQARVASQAGASGPALAPIDLRAAATAWSKADDDAYGTLEAALVEVRTYETKLDGELVIMRDLDAPIQGITAVRDDADRTKLYAALAYQGFAVNRFFMEGLADAPEAEPYRAAVNEVVVELPWMDAVALDPTRDVTPYDIAEAPQRVAYKKVAEVVGAALPASLTPEGLPSGARLVIDGRPVTPGAAGNVKLPPGRHLAHVELDGRIIARWDLRLAAGEARSAAPDLDEATWTAFLDGLSDGTAVPDALRPHLEALGGEVWIARPGDREPEVFAVGPVDVRSVKLEKVRAAPSADSPLTGIVGLQGGWFYSGDFYVQDPLTPDAHTPKRVNAASVSVLAAADLGVRGFHVSAGLQTWLTLGDKHVALVGDDPYRVRPYPHVGVGIRYVQATAGYLFPYHPGFGGRAMIPVLGPLEVQASALYGLPGELKRKEGSDPYESEDIRTVQAGVGLRF